ncbi:MAG TPA: energy transducer TonB, partial [Balneola sp.]|nr:energy transducer TonB [Balneola sp.]
VNPRVIRGIGGGCDEEALRVIKTAKFTPGMQRGRPVQVQMSLPILFKLSN